MSSWKGAWKGQSRTRGLCEEGRADGAWKREPKEGRIGPWGEKEGERETESEDVAGRRWKKCGWNGNETARRCSEQRRGAVSGTTRWYPNKSKIGGTLYRQCWYCYVLNDTSREENVRLLEIFRWNASRGSRNQW